MNVQIYQIDMERDANRVKFWGLEKTMKASGKVDPSIYHKVFDGEVDCKDLEEVYTKFNTDHPAGFTGHNLFPSDVVGNEDGFYFCDHNGFSKIQFDPTQTIRQEKSPELDFSKAQKGGEQSDVQVKIVKNFPSTSAVRAIAKVTIDGKWVVHGVKIIHSDKGDFISMPRVKAGSEYYDIFHPGTRDAREQINKEVMDAYQQYQTEQQTPAQEQRQGLELTPQMAM